MRFSWRRKFVVSGFVLALAGGGVAWWANSGPPVPVYEGRPISELLDENPSITQAYFGLVDAVRTLKGEAVPYLVHVLKNEPTMPQQVYQDLYFGMPKGVRQRFPAPGFYESRRGTCASLLGLTGSNGIPQIPFLARLSREDSNWMVRANAMGALERLGPGSEFESVALEALMAATSEADVRLAQSGYGRLGAFTNRTAEVVPVLLKGLENPKVRDECIYALNLLGGANEPLIRAALERGEARAFQEHMESRREAQAQDAVLKLTELF